MVRVYKRKTDRRNYATKTVDAALHAVKGGMSVKKASTVFGLPRTTLRRRLASGGTADGPSTLGRFKPVFNHEFECELLMHVVQLQQMFYGINIVEFRRLAYELAERNALQHPFSREKKLAGIDWARGFLSRYPELSLRKPEATSMSRLTGFNKIQVGRFFDLLKGELSKLKVTAKQIYNIDETGITTVQVPGKVLARKGSKQVGRVVSAERGTTTTVVCGMSASGIYVPPMFIFKRKNMNSRLMNNCTHGAIGVPSPSGWMDTQLFVRYLQHFTEHTKPSESNPILIILDGHQSHKSIEAIEYARDNHLHLLTIPPHTSHKLQPLDLTFFGPMKTAYNRAMDAWMLAHPGQRVTDYDLCELFSGAYQKVATIDKAAKGFKSSGIYPLDEDIFAEEDYAPASVTEQPVTTGSQSTQHQTPHRPTRVSVLEVSPLPHVTSTGVRKRRAESSSVITSSPYKAMLENKVAEKRKRTGRPARSRCPLEVPERSRKGTEKQEAKVTTQARKTQKTQFTDGAQSSCHQKKPKPATVTQRKRHSCISRKTSGHSKRQSRPVYPRPPECRFLTPRKPVWLQEKQRTGTAPETQQMVDRSDPHPATETVPESHEHAVDIHPEPQQAVSTVAETQKMVDRSDPHPATETFPESHEHAVNAVTAMQKNNKGHLTPPLTSEPSLSVAAFYRRRPKSQDSSASVPLPRCVGQRSRSLRKPARYLDN